MCEEELYFMWGRIVIDIIVVTGGETTLLLYHGLR